MRSRQQYSQLFSRRAFALLAATAAASALAPWKLQQAFAVTSAEKKAEADEMVKKLDALQTELNEVYAQYDEAVAVHENALALMQDAETREAEAEQQMTDVQAELGARAAQTYRNGNTSYLGVLFGATTFSDFVTSWDMISRLNERDAQLVQDAKNAKAEAEEARTTYAEQERVASEKEKEIEQLKADLEVKSAEMQAEVDRLSAEAAELQAQEELAAEQARLWEEEQARRIANNGGSEVSSDQLGRVPYFIYPLPSHGTWTSGFGPRWGTVHLGLDIAVPSGTPVYAAAAGTIVRAEYNSSGGNWVWIMHGGGVVTKYMHASAFASGTAAGVYVTQGTTIMYVGSTGNSTGPHLHFQVEIDGVAVNPVPFLP
ncbi:MAG: peptidoglycan DD-metalloendopeptidase family protein [Coriobacteriales bacterium]|jgi:murein DD-endopeptidase MepM/ murein hydrolase activator NlpD|nr:peptidoglycan DD-metalloendopeptidase family protein [Coriobacteriales bacterium]